jgi:hypothetical protein
MYLFVRLALYYRFGSFRVVGGFTRIGLENATNRNSQNSRAKGYLLRFPLFKSTKSNLMQGIVATLPAQIWRTLPELYSHLR